MIGKILWLLATLLLANNQLAEAQQLTKLPAVGYLRSTIIPARQEAFRHGLRELGYLEGKNIVIDWRSSGGNPERLRARVAEPIRLNVDVIVTSGSGVTRAAKETTVTIPIVMTQDNDPVASGIWPVWRDPAVTSPDSSTSHRN